VIVPEHFHEDPDSCVSGDKCRHDGNGQQQGRYTPPIGSSINVMADAAIIAGMQRMKENSAASCGFIPSSRDVQHALKRKLIL
jgi:hypothetical protein